MERHTSYWFQWTKQLTAMHTQDFGANHGDDGHHIEDIRKRLPDLDGITALAVVVEPVDAIDTGTLVVAPQQIDLGRVLERESQEQAYGLE